jgi:hypothetical protein
MANRVNPTSLPPWLAEADVDVYVEQFERTGYRGGLNWYRNIDRNWELKIEHYRFTSVFG